MKIIAEQLGEPWDTSFAEHYEEVERWEERREVLESELLSATDALAEGERRAHKHMAQFLEPSKEDISDLKEKVSDLNGAIAVADTHIAEVREKIENLKIEMKMCFYDDYRRKWLGEMQDFEARFLAALVPLKNATLHLSQCHKHSKRKLKESVQETQTRPPWTMWVIAKLLETSPQSAEALAQVAANYTTTQQQVSGKTLSELLPNLHDRFWEDEVHEEAS